MKQYLNPVVLVYTLVSTVLTAWLGFGMHFHGSLPLALVASLALDIATLATASLVFPLLYNTLKLKRMGWLLQCSLYCLIGSASIWLTGLVLPGNLVVTNALGAGAFVTVLNLALALVTGQASWSNWLPVRSDPR